MSFLDITGQRFGRLIALYRLDYGKPRSYWRCKCDCGNEVDVQTTSLRIGNTISCGCYRSECLAKPRRIDLSGKRFGKLLVIGFSHSLRNGKWTTVFWDCVCDCGSKKKITSSNLLSGGTISCGCARDRRRITHGMSHTREYNKLQCNRRRERHERLDSQWTIEMDIALLALFDRCVVCGSSHKLSVDHLIALDLGEGLKPGNAIILCTSCNSSKKNHPLDNLPKRFSDDDKNKMINAAKLFLDYWEKLQSEQKK